MNLPKTLPQTKNTLYIGLGGGYDIFGAIPIHEALQSNAVFVSVASDVKDMARYKPFYQLNGKDGAYRLATQIKNLVDQYAIDTIIGVDGGVDCLMHGDEMDSGTVLQDFITLAALDNLKEPANILVACVGFGAETDEGMNHYRVLENIAQLVRDNAFLGSCSLVGDMAEYAHYKYAVENWSHARKSHIQTRVIAAVEGKFGNPSILGDPNLSEVVFTAPIEPFINPLMSLYWFFRFVGIVKNNKIIPHIKEARTNTESLMKYRAAVTRVRDKKVIPL